MRYTYRTRGTCSRAISFDIDENDIITNVAFMGGCDGNLQGISRLVDGMNVDEIVKKCRGISCGGKPTSCPDQLAQAIVQAREAMKK